MAAISDATNENYVSYVTRGETDMLANLWFCYRNVGYVSYVSYYNIVIEQRAHSGHITGAVSDDFTAT
ncbi:MAG: hypothetical protein KUG70_14770 [Rhodobacteraceae bacterium]|nr:hypothetical protein [Paracoccaceae bacterium]